MTTLKIARENCKKSAVKHFIEKPILLNSKNFKQYFFQYCTSYNRESTYSTVQFPVEPVNSSLIQILYHILFTEALDFFAQKQNVRYFSIISTALPRFVKKDCIKACN